MQSGYLAILKLGRNMSSFISSSLIVKTSIDIH